MVFKIKYFNAVNSVYLKFNIEYYIDYISQLGVFNGTTYNTAGVSGVEVLYRNYAPDGDISVVEFHIRPPACGASPYLTHLRETV